MKRIVLYTLKTYKKYMSPLFTTYLGSACRFTPTCSQYTIEAVEKKGILKGLSLGFKRVLRCNPFYKSGYDPVT